jgi:hypothetical protein
MTNPSLSEQILVNHGFEVRDNRDGTFSVFDPLVSLEEPLFTAVERDMVCHVAAAKILKRMIS